MKFSKSNIILSTMMSAAALFATASHAADNPLQAAYKSTNVKSALVNVCKDQTAKGGKLTSAEVSKFCSCQIDAQGNRRPRRPWFSKGCSLCQCRRWNSSWGEIPFHWIRRPSKIDWGTCPRKNS